MRPSRPNISPKQYQDPSVTVSSNQPIFIRLVPFPLSAWCSCSTEHTVLSLPLTLAWPGCNSYFATFFCLIQRNTHFPLLTDFAALVNFHATPTNSRRPQAGSVHCRQLDCVFATKRRAGFCQLCTSFIHSSCFFSSYCFVGPVSFKCKH